MNRKHSDITLEVDLGAIRHNYETLAKAAPSASCAAVVKANAYGLGVEKVSQMLYSAKCRNFFVATLDEALELTTILGPDAKIYVFHGIKRTEENEFASNGIIPTINDFHQLEIWSNKAKQDGLKLPAVLHFDTGMNRLGFNWQDAEKVSSSEALKFLDVKYIMSHLVSAENPKDNMNMQQLQRITLVKKYFPKTPVSLSNSWGIQAGKDYHFDMLRPGCALYGVRGENKIGLKHVINVKAKIIQIREVAEDGFVGYGATKPIKKGARIAVVPLGYADGYLRSLSNNSHAYFGEKKCELLGRVSMDMTIFDISSIAADKIKVGDELEMIGDRYTVDQVATNAGTIGYEVLTNLGHRYKRVYKS